MAAQVSSSMIGREAVSEEDESEEERIDAFINELAEREGYDLLARDLKCNGNAPHASLNAREAHATKQFRKDVRALLKKHGLVFA